MLLAPEPSRARSHARFQSSLAYPRARFDLLRVVAFACLPLLAAASGCESDEGGDGDGTQEEVDASTDNSTKPGEVDGATGPGTPPGKPNIDAGPTKPGTPRDDAATSPGDAAIVDNSTPDGSTAAEDAGVGSSIDSGIGDAAAAAEDAGRRDGGRGRDGGRDSGRDSGTEICGSRGLPSCGAGQFCSFPADSECGATDRGGVCAPRPEACTQQYDPVCGCDNRTYGNACTAASSGVSVQHDGECGAGPRPRAGVGETCAGFAGIACEDGLFCSSEPAVGGDGCENIADGAGKCQVEPRACTREYRPVCGCDYHTYSNECEAHRAGVSVLREDACTEVDCQKIGGEVVTGLGPAPVCGAGTVSVGPVRFSNGQIPIEGAICCVDR